MRYIMMVERPIGKFFPDVDTFSDPLTDWDDLEKQGKILYAAYILPNEEKLEVKYGHSLARKIEYRMLDGGETWVEAGVPDYTPLEDLVEEGGIELSPEIRAKSKSYNFGYIKLACGFGGHTGSPHPMKAGRMTVTILVNSEEHPMIYGWCPKDTSAEQKIEKEYSLSPSLDFVPFKLEGRYKKHIEFNHLTPIITAVGGQTSKMTWRYHTAPNMDQIEGGREGRIVIRFPKDATSLRIKVDVEATVIENFKERVFPFSKKWSEDDFKDFREEEFTLTHGIELTYNELHNKRFKDSFAEDLLQRGPMSDADKTYPISNIS